jgi:hypothetical protein
MVSEEFRVERSELSENRPRYYPRASLGLGHLGLGVTWHWCLVLVIGIPDALLSAVSNIVYRMRGFPFRARNDGGACMCANAISAAWMHVA